MRGELRLDGCCDEGGRESGLLISLRGSACGCDDIVGDGTVVPAADAAAAVLAADVEGADDEDDEDIVAVSDESGLFTDVGLGRRLWYMLV